MTSIKNQPCACPEKGMRHSPKAHNFTSTERRPSNLEKYKECHCTDGRCKMSQLLKICHEDPDLIINMYRTSKSADKCLPEIEMDGGQVHESSEQLNKSTGNKKYHYLMNDQSTSVNSGDWHHQPTKKVDAKVLTIQTEKHENIVLGKEPPSDSCVPTVSRKTSQSSPGKLLSDYPDRVTKSCLHKSDNMIEINDESQYNLETSPNNTATKSIENVTKNVEDVTKNVTMAEATSHTLNERIDDSLATYEVKDDPSHIMSVLNLVVKKQKESAHTMTYSTKHDRVLDKKCRSWLGCLPCVKNKKHKHPYFRHDISVVSSAKSSFDSTKPFIVWE